MGRPVPPRRRRALEVRRWRFPQVPRLAALPGFVPEAAAWQVFLEFLTGYIVEKALSVDNIFIFVVIFTFFHIPSEVQHRVLFWGSSARSSSGRCSSPSAPRSCRSTGSSGSSGAS